MKSKRTATPLQAFSLALFIVFLLIAPSISAAPTKKDMTNLDNAVKTLEQFFYKNYKEYRVNTRNQLLDTTFYTTNITIKNKDISQVTDFYVSNKYMALHMFYTKSGDRATRYNQLDSSHSSKPYSQYQIVNFVNNFLALKLSNLLQFQSQILEPIPGLKGFYLLEVKEYYNHQLMQTYTLVSDGDLVTFDLIEIGSGIEYGDFYQYNHPHKTLQNIKYTNYRRIFGNGRNRNKMLIIADLHNTYTEMIIRNYLPAFKRIPSIDIYFLPFPQKSRYTKSQLLTNIFSASTITNDSFIDYLPSHNISQLNSSQTLNYFANLSSNKDEFLSLVSSERIKLLYDNIIFQNLFLGVDVTPWVVYNGNIVKGYNEPMFLYVLNSN